MYVSELMGVLCCLYIPSIFFLFIDNMCTPDRHSLVQDLVSSHVSSVCFTVSPCVLIYVQVLSVQQPPGQGLH